MKSVLRQPSLWLIGVLILVVISGPWLAPHDPLAVDLSNVLAKPSSTHWAGTDQLGRDVFSRVLAGGQRTVSISLAALVVSAVVGTLVGLYSGYVGRKTDWAIMRVSDAFISFPEYVVAIVITGILGSGYLNLLVAIVVVKWVGYTKLVRSIVLEERSKNYITVAQISGVPTKTILFRHLLPQVWGSVLSFSTMELGKIVLLVASLSFLGLGVPQPAPEWGFMLNEGRGYFAQTSILMLAPGLAILLFVLATSVVGDRLSARYALDTRKKGGERGSRLKFARR